MTRDWSLPLEPMACAARAGVDVAVLEVEQGLKTLSLAGIFKERGLFETQAVDGFLQILILLADVAKIDVVLPEVDEAYLGAMDCIFRRSDDGLLPRAG